MTGQDFVNEILLKLGVYDPGENPNPTESAAAIVLINELIDNWNAQQLMAIAAVETAFALSANVQTYTIGTGATFNIARPSKIVAASITILSGPTMPVEIVPAAKWASLPDRDISGNWVRYLFYDRGYPDGVATAHVKVSPKPLAASTLNLITWQTVMVANIALGSPIVFPPSYQRALAAASAKAMASSWSIQMSQEMLSEYNESMAELRRLNSELFGDLGAAPVATAAPIPPAAAAPQGG